jgi:hypothetical protein
MAGPPTRKRIALATCLQLPEPDPEAEPLRQALVDLGHEPVWAAWDDEQVAWGEFDVCVLRSTWDYTLRPEEFLEWVDRVGAQVPLHNPPAVVRWNAHKRYLVQLAEQGFDVVPTELVERGERRALAGILASRGWEVVVIKPAISAGSRETMRCDSSDRAAGEAHLARLLATEDVLVQEYQTSVEGPGERSLTWIQGELTHASRKSPRFGDDHEEVTGPIPIADDERQVALRLLEATQGLLDQPLLYGRVDLARGADGRPQLMELELIEPSLFTHLAPHALERLARAIAVAS